MFIEEHKMEEGGKKKIGMVTIIMPIRALWYKILFTIPLRLQV